MISQIYFLIIKTILICIIIPINSQCLEDQSNLLFQLKDTLQFNLSFSAKLIRWNQDTDCCLWEGVVCSRDGYVIGLDLSSESIIGGITNSTALFQLGYLQSLNLANNSFNYLPIPSSFGTLTNLKYLNLSDSGFGGQIPIELSRMKRLVTLDLSIFFATTRSLKLENPNLIIFIQNFTSLTELNLDGVNISAQGSDWSRAVSSSLPNLRTLSLSNCQLSGKIDSSLLDLKFLSVIRLNTNNLNIRVPEFLGNFKSLTALDLGSCNLKGELPENIFNIQTLQILDLSDNELLNGSLPEFPPNTSLQTLLISNTNVSAALPNSIGNLKMLSELDISNNNLSGSIPNSIQNLTQLIRIDLAANMFNGPIPSFQRSINLVHVHLYRNNFSGPIPSNHFKGCFKLESVDLRYNSFTGNIPTSLFDLPSLRVIVLSNNKFDGPLAEIPNASYLMLESMDLQNNRLQGEIPYSFFDLKRLNLLSLSFNNLNGTVKLDYVKKLVSLTTLDLSYNNLSIETSQNSSWYISPNLTVLSLASCNLQNFPDLRNQTNLNGLDLSNNQISGEIPNWVWNLNSHMTYLNLSHNFLENLQQPYTIPSTVTYLDLHSNYLRGELPIPRESGFYVDFSSNYFSSSIPYNLGNNLISANYFSAANNNLTETIPESICNATFLQVLDLSNNKLTGSIPTCLIEWSESTLGVLNLGKNHLTGNLSGTFQNNCGLQTLDLHDNNLTGEIPKSLENCTLIEVLNLGNNKILDTFPSFLINSTNLRVLVLRSNLLHGGIQCSDVNMSWPNLQIIDIASNEFSGVLIKKCFLNWKSMMDDDGYSNSEASLLRFEYLNVVSEFNYLDTVTIANKGQQMELVKILTIFTVVDFSNNNFEGEIPDSIGDLKSLYVLNLSQNAFTGSIPQSFGNMKELGSLDLSANKLTGKIPEDLARLTFLSFLNMSYNRLAGKIPTSTQFQSFNGSSFEGNSGLCGPPLTKSCINAENEQPRVEDKNTNSKRDEAKWEFLGAAGVGFSVGLGILIVPLFFCKRWNEWYWKFIGRVSSSIINDKYLRTTKVHKRPIRQH